MITTLLLATVLLAADPQAAITGDKTTLCGKAAKISAATSVNAKNYKWLVTPDPLDAETRNDGADLRISHDEPGTFYLTLIVSSPDGGIDVATWTLQVVAKAKAATPPLAQQAPFVGSLQSTSSLARQVAKELAKMDQPKPATFDAVGLLKEIASADIKSDARKVSNCLLQECRFLEGLPTNTQPDVAKIVKSTVILCKGSMTAVQWQSWSPWFEELGAYLDDLAGGGELQTLQDYADVLHGVATDLKDFAAETE